MAIVTIATTLMATHSSVNAPLGWVMKRAIALTLKGTTMLKKKHYEGLAERIAQSREEKGLNQHELARLCNITHGCVNRAERGKSTPHDYTLGLIAQATGTSIEFLKYGKE